MVNNNNSADILFEKKSRAITENIDREIPKTNAWFLLTFPVGIGLRQVLVINASRSDSYHIFNAPAAPAPIDTNIIAIIASFVGTIFGAISKPTAQVKITKDITLGFISLKSSEKLKTSS
jgi:hypothetical protein